ncbi:hypothetical protein AQJ54_31195 [Streptomyces griseorubiginosus]|uniref:Uncharacterized protein n=2 Tax=Streptomyces griseorubiginosus TaxID=67304 RepID=A0A101RVI1_9ACTN|nr:hypothetical protein AQJ54_31195 [Streptomyces griseorubiginosus]
MITVKTYPELSNKYRETSCVAGIRLDQGEPQHVRLFPVPFRLLSEDAQFSKYSIIEVDVEPHRPERDSRPESLRPDLDTLEIVGAVPSDGGWKKRYRYVEPLVAPSLCAIKRDQEQRGTSLGVFQPAEITRFRLEPAEPWSVSKAALADQLDLFEQELNPLEWVPLDFRYSFRCADDDCPTHDMGLKDWEAGQSYRKFLRKYGERGVREALRETWYDRMCAPNRAIHFFVGNIAAHPKTFMLLAVFYPERKVVEYVQDSPFGE